MRGKNEGSIYEVPGVGWKGAISLGCVNGKLKRKVIQRMTRAEVARELEKLLAARRPDRTQTFTFEGVGRLSVRTEKDSVTILFSSRRVVAA
jgi:hypothetical protein